MLIVFLVCCVLSPYVSCTYFQGDFTILNLRVYMCMYVCMCVYVYEYMYVCICIYMYAFDYYYLFFVLYLLSVDNFDEYEHQ